MSSTWEVSNSLWKTLAGTEDVSEFLTLLSKLIKLHGYGSERGNRFSKVTQQISGTSPTAWAACLTGTPREGVRNSEFLP